MKTAKILGLVLIVAGLAYIFFTLGILKIQNISGLGYLWPVGIVLIGIALVYSLRWLIALGIIILVVFGLFSLASEFTSFGQNARQFQKDVFQDNRISHLNIKISHSAGKINISAGDNAYLAQLKVKTNDITDPGFNYTVKDDTGNLAIQRYLAQNKIKTPNDEWVLLLSTNPQINIYADYGIGRMDIDLRKLQVDNINLNSGASETNIIFENYATNATINTGASQINIKIPKQIAAQIKITGLPNSVVLNGFNQSGDTYYSSNYKNSKENIKIKIIAGFAGINAQLY